MSTKSIKIIVLGDRGVGKTSLIERYVFDTFHQKPNGAPGLDLEDIEDVLTADFVEKRIMVDDKEVTVSFWDPPPSSSPPPHSYYAGAHGCCLVFSTVDAQSLHRLHFWYESVQKFCSQENCPPPPIVISENKLDLIERSVVDADAVEKAAKQFRLRLYRTSAKQGHQVKELFDYIAAKATKYERERKDFEDSAGVHCPRANGQSVKMNRTPSAASWILPSDDRQNKLASEPSKRRTGGVKPLFNMNKCPVM